MQRYQHVIVIDSRALENSTGDKNYIGLLWHKCYVTKLAGDSRALENSTGDDKK